MLYIFTDGSCKKNPKGPGGYSIIVMDKDNTEIFYAMNKKINSTTNNREELKAIIEAINYADSHDEEYIIYSDSMYCINSINNWMYTWYLNNWETSKHQPVENLDLIKILYKLCDQEIFHNFQLKKIKGHNNNIGNELADAAATFNKEKFKKILLTNHIKVHNQKNLDK